jgi:hypothetical protein
MGVPGKKKPWTAKERQYLIDHWGKMPIENIAINLGRSQEVVRAAAQRYKLGCSKTKLTPRVEFVVRDMHKAGKSDNQIGANFNVSSSTVQRWREQLGLLPTSTPSNPSDQIRDRIGKIAKRRQDKKRAMAHYCKGRSAYEDTRMSARGYAGAHNFSGYPTEESEFLQAINRFRSAHHRIPSLLEGLHIAKSLGWQKQEGIDGS